MFFNRLSLVMSFTLAFGTPNASAAEISSAQVEVDLGVDLQQRVGTSKAGTMCLPAGVHRGADFLTDKSEFLEAIKANLSDKRAALGEVKVVNQNESVNIFSVKLMQISSSLCARRWGALGLGDRSSFSGRAKFVFAWQARYHSGSERQGEVEINLNIDKSQATSTYRIFRRAVDQFLNEIFLQE